MKKEYEALQKTKSSPNKSTSNKSSAEPVVITLPPKKRVPSSNTISPSSMNRNDIDSSEFSDDVSVANVNQGERTPQKVFFIYHHLLYISNNQLLDRTQHRMGPYLSLLMI